MAASRRSSACCSPTARALSRSASRSALPFSLAAATRSSASFARSASLVKSSELAEENKGRISDRWLEMQEAWNQAIAKVREDIEGRKAEHDLHHAQRTAERAEDDARFAIDFAYSAIVEAEYAVLDASLERMEADEQSEKAGKEANASV